jgi:hypothetical protein
MTHQYIDQSFLILRDTFTLDQPLLGRDFLKTSDVKLGFHPSFSITVNGHILKTESIKSVQPKNTPIHYSSVSPSANESLVPGVISKGASVSNYNHLPSSNVDLARYHLLHNARMGNASQNTPSLPPNSTKAVSPPFVFLKHPASKPYIQPFHLTSLVLPAFRYTVPGAPTYHLTVKKLTWQHSNNSPRIRG